MSDTVLALNAGSSSLKFGLFAIGEGDTPMVTVRGQIETLQSAPHMSARDGRGALVADRRWAGEAKIESVLADLLAWIEERLGDGSLLAAGHRIVHGGRDFVEPAMLDDTTLAALTALTPLAPLHQPGSLAPVRALRKLRPELPQVGCFDTAFHHTLDPLVSRYAIPEAYAAKGVRRYGFHGLSYEFIARSMRETAPDLARGRVVVAHLGSGASLCAMRDGRSLDTTMGFTALDGLMMGTRCGAIDPGVLLYLQQGEGLSVGEVETLLYRHSGLIGVSGISPDVRVLLESDAPAAAEALDLFASMAARQTAVMANTLEGIDGLVFTGGIGEHGWQIREKICKRLRWLGVALDAGANAAHASRISARDSRVDVRVMATDEESMIARHAYRTLSP